MNTRNTVKRYGFGVFGGFKQDQYDGTLVQRELSMSDFVRGAVRATVISVKGDGMAAIRITAPSKVRNGVRIWDLHPTTAMHLGQWLLSTSAGKHESA